jgi:hypothetical protein
MAFSVVMPALEMAQETGKLLAWRKKEGESVAKGEPLLSARDGLENIAQGSTSGARARCRRHALAGIGAGRRGPSLRCSGGGNAGRGRSSGARNAGSGRPAHGRANRSKLDQRAAFLRGARSRCGRIPRSARTVGLGDFTGARTAASLATPPDRSAGSRSVQNRAVGP